MQSSNGAPSNRRGAFSVSPAARYREIRVNRTVYLVGILLLIAPWVIWLQTLWNQLNTPTWVIVSVYHTTLVGFMRINLQAFTQGTSGPATFYLIMAAAMGIALFAYDRLAGGLFYSLEGPLRRREVVTAKALFGTVIILLPAAAGTAGTLLFAAASGNLGLAGVIVLRGLIFATGALSLFATALALGSAMGMVFSSVATATWAALPSLLQSLLSNLFLVPGRQVVILGGQRVSETTLRFAAPWIAQLAQSLPILSPFQPGGFYGWSLTATLALIAWFTVWTALMLWLAPGWWERAPFERLHDGVFFPFLWNLYYTVLSLASALVVTELLTHGTVYGVAWAAIYLVLFVAGWFFWRFVVRRRGGRADSRRQVSA